MDPFTAACCGIVLSTQHALATTRIEYWGVNLDRIEEYRISLDQRRESYEIHFEYRDRLAHCKTIGYCIDLVPHEVVSRPANFVAYGYLVVTMNAVANPAVYATDGDLLCPDETSEHEVQCVTVDAGFRRAIDPTYDPSRARFRILE
jgi:hypothetical protein